MSKPTVAVYKFSSCDGCQLSLLNLEDELLDIANAVEIAYFLEARRRVLPGPYDIGLVEGSVTSQHEIERIMEIRSQVRKQNSTPAANLAGEEGAHPPVRMLMLAIVQYQDQKKAVQALDSMGLTVIRLASSGAFLGRRNVTLMVGLPPEQLEEAVKAIHQYCHQRVEYVSTPLEGAPMPIPLATPITVGGATVFTLEVDRFEEL